MFKPVWIQRQMYILLVDCQWVSLCFVFKLLLLVKLADTCCSHDNCKISLILLTWKVLKWKRKKKLNAQASIRPEKEKKSSEFLSIILSLIMALFKEIWCEHGMKLLESGVDDMKLSHHLGRMHDQPLTGGISCVTSCALLKKMVSGVSNTHTATREFAHHDSLWEGLAGFRDCILHARHDITPHCHANNLPSTQQGTKTQPKQVSLSLSLSHF